MTNETTQATLYVFINEEGSIVASHDRDIAVEAQEDEGGATWREVILNLTLPMPEAIEVAGVVPADGEEFALTIA